MIKNLRISPEGCTANVKSHTVPDLWYVVIKSADGEYRCNCPRNFIKKIECKHIDEVMTALRIQEMQEDWSATHSLYIAHFRIGGNANHYQAIVCATSNECAEARVRTTYYKVKDLTVLPTGRQVVIR